jgi:hypothetical protein
MSIHSLAQYEREDKVHQGKEIRKATLVALGQWALSQGRWPLVWDVSMALGTEGLIDA